MFTYPFEIIKARLAEKLPLLRELDWYMEQDSTKDKSAWILASPSLYIEIVPVDDVVLYGNKMQSQLVDINIILLTENVSDKGSKRLKKDDPKDHMTLYDAVNVALHGFNAKLSYLTAFSSLLNTSQDQRILNSLNRQSPLPPPHRVQKSMMKSVQSFRTIIYDHSACKKYTKLTGTDLDVELE